MTNGRPLSPNEFEEGTPRTAGRDASEAAIEQLRQKGGIFVEAVRATRMPMAVTDPSLPGNPIVFANQAFLSLSGYQMDEVLGQQPHFMDGPETGPDDARRFGEALERGEDIVVETCQYRKDGSKFYAAVFCRQLTDEEGRPSNALLSFMDLTERVEAERKLREQAQKLESRVEERTRELAAANERLQRVLETPAVGVLFFDGSGVLVQANDAFLSMTGYTREQVQRRELSWRNMTPQDWHAASEEEMRKLQQTGQLGPYEKQYFLADGSCRWMMFAARDLGDGTIVEFCFDVTQKKEAEEALRESERRLRLVLEGIGEAFYVLDAEWRFVFASRAALALWAKTEGDLIGRRFLDVFPQAAGSEPYRAHDRAMTTREAEHFEAISPIINRWIEADISPSPDGGLSVALRDIDARKCAEFALRESEERLAAAFEVLPAGIAVLDVRGEVVVCNSLMRGYMPNGRIPSADVEQKRRWQFREPDGTLIPPDQWPGARALRGERVVPGLEALFTQDDGREIWTRVATVPLREDGTVVGAVSMVLNIDAEKRSMEALRESEARFREFGEASSDLLWIRNAETLCFEYVSPAFERLYGVPREQMLGNNDVKAWLELIHPDDRDAAVQALRTLRKGAPSTLEFRAVRPDGTIRWLHDTDFPLLDERGNVRRIAGIAHDVTERKRAVEMQSTLLAELQHRVRNTLAVVRSIARRTAERSSSVEEMISHFEGRLNAFSRVQAVVTRSAEGGVDLKALIEDELLAVAVREGDHLRIYGPRTQLGRRAAESMSLAVHELATNAVKYGALAAKDGRIAVGWRRVREDGSERLELQWVESGLDAPPKPAREGFGLELLRRTLPYDLRAETDIEFTSDGLRFAITVPLGPDVLAE